MRAISRARRRSLKKSLLDFRNFRVRFFCASIAHVLQCMEGLTTSCVVFDSMSTHQEILLNCLRSRQRNRIRILQHLALLVNIKREHRYWIHDIISNRVVYGAYHHLVRELELDSRKHHEYFLLSLSQMEIVLNYVGPKIEKVSWIREPIDLKQRLAICIR